MASAQPWTIKYATPKYGPLVVRAFGIATAMTSVGGIVTNTVIWARVWRSKSTPDPAHVNCDGHVCGERACPGYSTPGGTPTYRAADMASRTEREM